MRAHDPPIRGPAWFGRAYARMMRRDPHAPGSIDRRLLARAVGLDARTARMLYGSPRPPTSTYRKGSRPRLEAIAKTLREPDPEATVAAVAQLTSGLAARAPRRVGDLRFGGSEEAIVARGSDWCADVARVAAALLQVSGVPSRVVQLADTARAYSGHTVVEAFRRDRWGCVDSRTGVVYHDDRGRPASTWSLRRNPAWVTRHYRSDSAPYSRAGQFRRAAIAEYRLPAQGSALYRTSRVNPYYRSILRMSDRGWPGGLRWLFGEDR
jgi:hypothetical protein